MNIFQEQTKSQTQPGVQVTLLRLVGDLDGSNYRQVIAAAEQACAAGGRDLLLDLSEVNFMSSAGLVALHTIAMLMRQEQAPDANDGWNALTAMQDYADSAPGFEKHFKLLNVQPRVLKTLYQAGFDRVLEIFTEREAALAAYRVS